jgi:energy-converting hydrogenase Eha subunit H
MEYSDGAIIIIWSISLVIGAVVIGVVAFLLHKVRNTAKKIDVVVIKIWTEGKLVANNTIHIPNFLAVTNNVAGNIVANTVELVKGSLALKLHAAECPGCPACVFNNENK